MAWHLAFRISCSGSWQVLLSVYIVGRTNIQIEYVCVQCVWSDMSISREMERGRDMHTVREREGGETRERDRVERE